MGRGFEDEVHGPAHARGIAAPWARGAVGVLGEALGEGLGLHLEWRGGGSPRQRATWPRARMHQSHVLTSLDQCWCVCCVRDSVFVFLRV